LEFIGRKQFGKHPLRSKPVKMVLTPPALTTESEHYLRDSMGQECLNALAVLSIQKDIAADIPRFNQKVIVFCISEKLNRAVYLSIRQLITNLLFKGTFINYLQSCGLIVLYRVDFY
jgi:hypothetical protein